MLAWWKVTGQSTPAMVAPNMPWWGRIFQNCVRLLEVVFVVWFRFSECWIAYIQSSSTLPENTVELHPQSKVYILIFLGSHYNHMVLMCSLCMFKCMGGQISRRSLCRKSSGIVRNRCIEEAVSISINQRYWLRAESSNKWLLNFFGLCAEVLNFCRIIICYRSEKKWVLIPGFLRQNFGMGVWGSLIWRHPWSASVLVCVAPQW